MPTKTATAKPSGVKALARLRSERDEFEKREREARRAAAIELGEAVLKSADLALEPAQLNLLIAATMRHGFEETMALLSSAKPDAKQRRDASEKDADPERDHAAE